MPDLLTIIIPTHNRQNYLQRVVNYYATCKYPVLILDSSDTPFKEMLPPALSYIHLPKMSLPDKLTYGFSSVKTEFVVMCADDDFLIIDGLDICLHFLKNNRQYSVADGGILFYKKIDIFKNLINFNLLYKIGLNDSFDNSDPLKRIKCFFKNYRTVFYGVHYTENLKYVFQQCNGSYSNLYLNEYLTALFPLAKGYCKIIPTLTAVRESTDVSGDKTTININNMFGNAEHEKELETYVNCVAQAIAATTSIEVQECINTIQQTLGEYANLITASQQADGNRTLTKRVGKIISNIPVAGPALVRGRRLSASKREISVLIKTETDKKNLQMIEAQILKFQTTC